MDEKVYKTMGSSGAASLAVGICVLVGGIVAGILLIDFNKTKVLAQKANDTLYVNMAQHFLEHIRLFKENIKYINSKP